MGRMGVAMSAATAHQPIVHFVGSIPLPDAETVFRTLAAATGAHLKRLPDGETGVRRTWLRFLQQVLAYNPGSRWQVTYRRSNSPRGTTSYCAKFHACA
jgi:hypothetical protein